MKTRQLGRALVALVAAAATIGLMGNPASANDAELTSGTLELYSSESNLMHQQDLGDEGASVECSTNTASFTVTGTNHAWSFTQSSHTSTFIAGQSFTVEFTVNLTGTSSSTGTSSGGGSATLVLHPNSSSTSGSTTAHCAWTTTADCTISVSNVAVTATHNVTSTGVTASSTATVNGGTTNGHGNFAFDVAVDGNACGPLLAANDGGATLTNVVVHATT